MFEQKIAEAKAVPILEIAQLFCEKFTYEKNKPTCACPRHKDEHIGNMAYYERTNTFYCFSCRTKFDGIDLVRFTLGVDLKTAVSEIEKHFPGYFSAQEIFTENDNFLSFDEIKKLGISPVLSFDKERISLPDLYKEEPEYVKSILSVALGNKSIGQGLRNKVNKIIFN